MSTIVELGPGDRYGEFQILELLGRGAFAAVYRVRAPGHETAALKLSLRPVGESDESRRALREIAVLQTLTNSHVVRVHEAGQGADGRVFILMDYLEGQQLDVFHDFDVPMAPAQAVWMVHQACLGLAEAHAHGIVHRDVKPANIWVEPLQVANATVKTNLNVRVIDFGLARAWDTPSTIGHDVTVGRLLVGTPHYMQPEQLFTQKLFPTSDVYSLAIVLYELLTGRCLFFTDKPFSVARDSMRDDPVPWLAAHRSKPPDPFEAFPETRDLPPVLGELVLQCLEKVPDLRPSDAGVLANALGSILHYEFGVGVGAMLRIQHPWGGFEDKLLLPGSHRIGSGRDVEIQLPEKGVKRVHAILEWGGLPELPQIRPMIGDGSVRVDGAAILRRTAVPRGAEMKIGPFVLELTYPEG